MDDGRAFALASSLVLESGCRLGEVMTGEQAADLRAVLTMGEPRRHWIGRPRGYSKTTDAAAATGAMMLCQAPAGARLYAGAADRDQARLLLDALMGLVERTPEVRGALSFDAYRASTRSGVVLEVLAADASSAHGLRPWALIIDELCNWADTRASRRFLNALTTALPKTPDARMTIITTAGDPTHFSRKTYESALAEPGLWRVADLHDAPPWIDQAEVEAEQRRLPDAVFARYWRNEWSASEDQAFDAGDVAACVAHRGVLDAQAGHRYVLTLDLGWRSDATAICVAHREGDGVVIDRVDRIVGSRKREVNLDVVEDRVHELARRYRARVFADPREAIGLMQRLRRRGLRVEEHTFSTASNTTLALRLLELIRSRRLALPDDDALISELLSVRIIERGPGLFKVDSSPGRHDDMAVVVGMAAVHLDRGGSGVEPVGVTAAGRTLPTRAEGPAVVLRYADGQTRGIGASDWRLRHARMVLRQGREPR